MDRLEQLIHSIVDGDGEHRKNIVKEFRKSAPDVDYCVKVMEKYEKHAIATQIFGLLGGFRSRAEDADVDQIDVVHRFNETGVRQFLFKHDKDTCSSVASIIWFMPEKEFIDRTLDILEKFEAERTYGIARAIQEVSKFSDRDSLSKTLEVFERFDCNDNLELLIKKVAEKKPSKYKSARVAEVLLKYEDNHYDDVYEAILLGGVDIPICEELLTDRAYNGIKKDPQFVHQIARRKYWTIGNKLGEFSSKLTYKDLDVGMDTYFLVKYVHENKGEDSLFKILNGYIDEMKRAVNQGTDFESKKKMYFEYCREVKNQIKERADELMVVTNE